MPRRRRSNAGERRTFLRSDPNNGIGPTSGDDDATTIHAPSPEASTAPSLVYIHHAAVKTRNITMAIQFYSLFGYTPVSKFRAGPARAAWLELDHAPPQSSNSSSSPSTSSAAAAGAARLELIEVPAYMLPPPQENKPPPRAPNLMDLPALLGYNHVALDVSAQIQQHSDNTNSGTTAADYCSTSLQDWIDALNQTSLDRFGKTLRVALPPRQQMIANSVYELAFLYDADGCLVELLHKVGETSAAAAAAVVETGWEPWDGQGFKGVAQ